MSKTLTIWIDNDNLLTISSLINQATGLEETGAAVEVTLKDEADNVVGAVEDWPIIFTEVDPGKYQATMRYDLVLTPGEYRGHFKVITDTDGRGSWTRRITAKVRG